jgi:Uma2 family endonuclease
MIATEIKFTLQEYFDLCEKLSEVSDIKLEYYDGLVYPLFGDEPLDAFNMEELQEFFKYIPMPKPNHAIINANMITSIGIFCRKDKRYRVFDSGLQVFVSLLNAYVFPDITVVEKEIAEFIGDSLQNPSLVIEVLSDSTAYRDRGDKFQGYTQMDSLQDYIMVSQNKIYVEHFSHQGTSWQYAYYKNLNDLVHCQSIPLTIPLSDIYADVNF